jgi:hypothetical protein
VTAQILLFTGVRRDPATGCEDIAALIAAAELAGKVRRFPAGLRVLPAPHSIQVHVPPMAIGNGVRRIDPVIYDEAAEDDCA